MFMAYLVHVVGGEVLIVDACHGRVQYNQEQRNVVRERAIVNASCCLDDPPILLGFPGAVLDALQAQLRDLPKVEEVKGIEFSLVLSIQQLKVKPCLCDDGRHTQHP